MDRHQYPRLVAAHALLLLVEIHLPQSQSLKDKRAVITSVLDGARRRFRVAAAETDHAERWQRSELAFTTVGSSVGRTEEVIDEVERFVWSHPELEVIGAGRHWLEID